MTEGLHPLAPHQAAFYITSPGQTDWLMVAMGIFLLLAVVGIGILYFKLHALPEHMAHKGQKVQFEIVAVLALLALFTHNHLFWVAGLLLALVPFPDFVTPLTSMAQSLGRAFVLHAIDATGMVHAMILRLQAILLPFQTLILAGTGGGRWSWALSAMRHMIPGRGSPPSRAGRASA